MCLMQTDFPVPEGPRIVVMLVLGDRHVEPGRIWLRPNDLWTSMNSTASLVPVGRCLPVCQRYSSVRLGAHAHPPMGAFGFAPQKICVPSMPIRCTITMFSTIDFAVAVPTPTGPPLAV